jgi:AcrR family transcriptional regulator
MSAASTVRRGRPRSDASERAIVEAALDMMAEGHGASAITISELSRRAGVGKDTLYRRWRTKDDLLLHALGSLYGPPDPHADGPIREVLIDRVAELIARMHDERNKRIYRSLLTASGGHPALRERFYAEVIEPRRDATRAVIAAAARRGELRADTDAGLLGALLFSPVLAETLEGRPRRPLRGAPRAVAMRLVDAVLVGALPAQ